ncbi:hypothetical protein ABT124_14185 [Streptomyces sp. NPDC001982]|uniref:hypothetical protein n=1 Tax=Streptomyces sp. NPDC001982 TaxID=3154405 RepID=UPI003329E64C
MATYTPRFPGSGTIIEEVLIEGEAKGEVKGEAKARAEDILRILTLRGIDVSETARERITSCSDLEVLGTWLDRTLTVSTAKELFQDA